VLQCVAKCYIVLRCVAECCVWRVRVETLQWGDFCVAVC